MKLRPFELALIVIFVVLMVIALFLLANYSPKPNSDGPVAAIETPVVIWGTLPPEAFEEVLEAAKRNDESFKLVSYQYVAPADFNWSLINALADQRGPDLIAVSHEKLVTVRQRLYPIPYESFPLPDIQNQYVDGAEIFALSDGLYALPLGVDPLMMYWNRDIFSTKGYISPPASWEQLVNTMFPDLIERDFDRTIRRGVVAMGEYGNVRNAFGVVSLLLIQGGSRLVEDEGNRYDLLLNQSVSGGAPLRAAADFYTRFSQPSNALYSWNRAQSEDRTEFAAEELALYFGYGSEGRVIQRLNPNLNFAVAEVPQGTSATVRRTYGKFYGLSILKTSDNFDEAWRVLFALGGVDAASKIATDANIVPAHRSEVAAGSSDIFGRAAYISAPIARGWLSPERATADATLASMMSDINENRSSIDASVNDARQRLQLAY